MSRDQKFHHRERLKARRRHYWGRDLSREENRLGKAINTPTPCSCLICGNARLNSGESMQERRAALTMADGE